MIYIVGMGPGNIDLVTPEAVRTIQMVDIVIAFGRIANTAQQIRNDVLVTQTVAGIEAEILKHQHQNIAILASGDPCFFGITKYLKSKGIKIDNIIAGLSSFQYMATKLGINWQTAAFFSFHGRKFDLQPVTQRKLSIILTDKNTPYEEISESLYNEGASGTIWAGSDLSYPNESIIERRIGEQLTVQSNLNVVFIQIESIEI